MLRLIKKIFTNIGPEILIKNKLKIHLDFKNLSKIHYQNFGKLNPSKKFYIIRRNPTAGFFSNITFILNHLKICNEMNFIPIIDMKNYPTLYNEKKKIKKTYNSWEYYFEKLNKYSLKEVYKSSKVFLSSTVFQKNMSIDINNRELKKHFNKIKIRKEILDKVKYFKKINFQKKDRILGVHFRGSTYKTARGHAFPSTSKHMIENIQSLINKFGYNKIFIVTEEQKYLQLLKKKFKRKLIFYDSYRMNKLDSFTIYPRKNHRYLLGEEILIETLLLSECKGLTFVKSNVISAALMFSKKKIKQHELYFGLNIRNKFFSRYLWYIRAFLPAYFGGLKLSNK